MERFHLTPSNDGMSVKHVVNLHVRVQQGRAIAGEIQAIKDQILKCLLKTCLSNQHCACHLPSQQQHPHKGGVVALQDPLRSHSCNCKGLLWQPGIHTQPYAYLAACMQLYDDSLATLYCGILSALYCGISAAKQSKH